MRYKAGDKVRVLTLDEMLERGGQMRFDGSVCFKDDEENCYFTTDMRCFCGKTVTIRYAGYFAYEIEEDDASFLFTEFMLEDKCETIRIKYHDPEMPRLEYIGGDKSNWIDLRTAEDVFIPMGEYRLISLGVSMELPKGYEAIIAPRSSTFKNFRLLQTNSLGVVDESYKGDNDVWRFPAFCAEAKHVNVVSIDENGNDIEKVIPIEEKLDYIKSQIRLCRTIKRMKKGTFIPKHTRICQFRIVEHQPKIMFEETERLGNSDRGGIGSTGVK